MIKGTIAPLLLVIMMVDAVMKKITAEKGSEEKKRSRKDKGQKRFSFERIHSITQLDVNCEASQN